MNVTYAELYLSECSASNHKFDLRRTYPCPKKGEHYKKAIINAHYHQSKDWSKSQLDHIKDNLKTYLRFLQHNECCYCRQTLGFDYRQVDIEHIVDKNDHESFGFEPKNLALSCPACNSCKTSQETMANATLEQYPSSSDAFLIVHPYFDDYSKHIEIQYPLYISKSQKGTNTINICKLMRLKAIEAKEKNNMLKMPLINALINGNKVLDSESELFEAIKAIINI